MGEGVLRRFKFGAPAKPIRRKLPVVGGLSE
jgi:hypothetical protein